MRFDFGNEETRIALTWATGGRISIVWPEESEEHARPYFLLEDEDGDQPRTPATVRGLFPPVTVLPAVTPLDRFEELKDASYIQQRIDTRLASRHFRNHAYAMHKRGEWDSFKEYCGPWLGEIKLLDVALNIHANSLAVFYGEPGSRVPKELAWAGDGIQIWVQLLWHLYRQSEAKTIVLDEPEVYLHPDLQRRLVRRLDSLPAQIILASHSADVIAEAPRDGILWVDRRGVGGRRARSAQTFSALSASLGSSYDLALVRSLRTRLVLACDCNDVRIIRALARSIGATTFASEQVVNVLQFRSTESDQLFGSALREVLPNHIPALLLLQPGYRPDHINEQIRSRLLADQIQVRVWNAVEIENYLLNVDVIARISGAAPEIILLRIQDALLVLRESTKSEFVSTRIRHAGDVRVADAVESAKREFDSIYSDTSARLRLVRGTRVIELLNQWFERDGYRTVDSYGLAKAARPNELADELVECLSAIEEMVTS